MGRVFEPVATTSRKTLCLPERTMFVERSSLGASDFLSTFRRAADGDQPEGDTESNDEVGKYIALRGLFFRRDLCKAWHRGVEDADHGRG